MPSVPVETLLPEAPFRLEKVSFSACGEAIGRLRVEAWRHERGVDQDFFARARWIEPIDDDAQHWVVFEEDQLVAAGRLSLHRGLTGVPYAQLLPPDLHRAYDNHLVGAFSRLVVLPTHRRHSFSTVLDHTRLNAALEARVQMMTGGAYLDFRQHALARLGFQTLYISPNGPEMPTTPVHFMVYNAVY